MTLSSPKENFTSRSDGRSQVRRAQPNLLFLFSDEHRACSLSGEPYCDVQTTHLRRLAQEGTLFGNCISNYPVCSPYRAMLLSGVDMPGLWGLTTAAHTEADIERTVAAVTASLDLVSSATIPQSP